MTLRAFALLVFLSLLTFRSHARQDAAADFLDLPLTETFIYSPLRYEVRYPEGWSVEWEDPVLKIRQPEQGGTRVVLDSRDFEFMHELGLSKNHTLEELAEFNAKFFEISEGAAAAAEQTSVEVFGVPALRVRVILDNHTAVDAVQGFTKERVFLLHATAPSKEMMAAFQPTFEEMLKSLRPLNE